MKKTTIFKLAVLLVVAVTTIVACTKDISDKRLEAKLATAQVLDITSSEATIVGFVVAEGSGVTERGVAYDVAPEPTIEKNKVLFDGTVTGATFNVRITGLAFATQYYAKAYLITSNGTIYGEEMTFTTLPIGPTVTTAAISDISYTSASAGGNVTATGGTAILARGVCYDISPNPTILKGKTSDGTGAGAFVSSMTGLAEGTTYYVRAYATNSVGTAYGEEVSFTTLVPQNRTWNIPGNYVEAAYPGWGLANWSPDKSPQVKSGLSAPDNLEGYVYMSGTANEWKFATKPNWDGPNYGDGGSGTISEAGGNFNSPAGYYFIKANATALTYSAVATVWGVIGDATPLGWGDETALTYMPALGKWVGGVHLTANQFKFRANHNWDYNYGAAAGSSVLTPGGDNIVVAVEDDYAITLDLSKPLDYSYSANRWGIIGSATAGGWDSDQNMTWNAVGGVFTATIDLVAGEMKFRANDDWGLNLGGDINALTEGGANIAVGTAGNYTITLNPWTRVATVTMN